MLRIWVAYEGGYVLTPYGEIPDRLAADMSLAEQHDWLAVRASRRTVLRGLLVVGASASPLFWQQTARAAPDVRVASRLLAPGADPGRVMTVGIAVPGFFRRGRVEAAPAAPAGGGGGAAELIPQPVRGSTVQYARAALTGLQPSTEYTYRVLLDGVAASSGTFSTAPAAAADFRFTAVGDQGTGELSRSMVRRVAALRPDLHLVAGDMSYANQEGTGGPGDFHPALWDAWLSENDEVSKSLPFLCTLGNHEMEPGFATHGYAGVLARVPLPGRSPLRCPASWALRYGTVGFVGLDSNDVSYELARNHGYTGGAQQAWLRTALEGFRSPDSGVEFVVVVLHHSPYSTNEAHGSEGGVRDAWVPLFDQYGVDLVIAGHNHCYERTLPLRAGMVAGFDAGRVDSTAGTTYVTAGGGGSNAALKFIREGRTRVFTAEGKQVETIDWSLPGRTGTHAVLVADVRPGGRPGATSTMTLQAVGRDGQILDTVELSRPATVQAPAPAIGGDGGRSAGAMALAGAAATAVAGGVTGALVLRRRRDRVHPETPVEQGSSKVVVRPLLGPGIDPETVVLRRAPEQSGGRTAPPRAPRTPGGQDDLTAVDRAGPPASPGRAAVRTGPGLPGLPAGGPAPATSPPGTPPSPARRMQGVPTPERPQGGQSEVDPPATLISGPRASGESASDPHTGRASDRPAVGGVTTGDRRDREERPDPDAPQPSGDLPPSPGAAQDPALHLPPVHRAAPDREATGRARDTRPVGGGGPKTGPDAGRPDVRSDIDAETVITRRATGLPDDGGRTSAPMADSGREADPDLGWFVRPDHDRPPTDRH
jgi:Calcineurin-like phosphoesterase